MANRLFSAFLLGIFRYFFSVKSISKPGPINPKSILVVRQHNQLGDMLVGSSLLTALKENYPDAKITFIASPQNAAALENNRLIDSLFIYNKKLLLSFKYIKSIWTVLRTRYDLCLSPATVSISFTNDFLARLSKSKLRIGVAELDGKKNKYDFFFNIGVTINADNTNTKHIAEKILAILIPLNITTANLFPRIFPSDSDNSIASDFLQNANRPPDSLVIGIHAGAGKPPNRWNAENFISLIKLLIENFNAFIYLTASDADMDIINNIQSAFKDEPKPVFLNKSIGSVAALISKSDLFITNDTGIMHVAASTNTKQISLFGPTNPKEWAPTGVNKHYLNNGESINIISVSEVYNLAKQLLRKDIQ